MPFFDFEPINKAPEVVQKKNDKKSKKIVNRPTNKKLFLE